MDSNSILLPVAAMCLAWGLIMAVVLRPGTRAHWSGRMFQCLMLSITVASVGTILLYGRDWGLQVQAQGLIDKPEPGTQNYLAAKLLLVAVVGYSVVLCMAWGLMWRNGRLLPRRPRQAFAAPADIVWAFMIYYVAFSILPIAFAKEHYFHVSLVYAFFVCLALLLWVQVSSVDPVVVAKQCLGLIVIASLGAAILAPEFAFQRNYHGLLSGFRWRLWGVTQANTLGAVACALLVLEAAEPSARRWLRLSVWAAAGFALVSSQAKTSLFAGLVGLSAICVWRSLGIVRQRTGSGGMTRGSLAVALAVVLGTSVAVAGVWVLFSDPAMLDPFAQQLDTRGVDDLPTATGRTRIWAVAVQGGLESPLFGQGADFWNEQLRLRLGLSGATHAHNLLLQAFSCAGFVGLTTLLIFLYFLLKYSIRASQITRGGTIGLMGMFMVRSIFEVPIQLNSILGAEFVVTMAYVFYAMDRGAPPKYSRSAPTPRIPHVRRAVRVSR
jgi:exopolysaccharide production protein ExoQ